MANEKRLIDANEMIASFQKLLDKNQHYKDTYSYKAFAIALQRLQDAPTVDAVEVVRCKDCKQWSRNSGIAESPNGHCFCHDIETNGHDFCSYGERR